MKKKIHFVRDELYPCYIQTIDEQSSDFTLEVTEEQYIKWSYAERLYHEARKEIREAKLAKYKKQKQGKPSAA